MIESNTSRVEFPDKDPEQWEMFYNLFVDPSNIGNLNNTMINEGNVMMLLPWFHEFQMQSHLNRCDEVLSESDALLINGWTEFKGIVELLQCACLYDLNKTMGKAEDAVESYANICIDAFTLPITKKLVELFLPLEVEDGNKLVSRGKSQRFWDILQRWDFADTGIMDLSPNAINNNELLSSLVYTFMQLRGKKEEAEKVKVELNGKTQELDTVKSQSIEKLCFLALVQVELLDLKNVTSPSGSSSLTAYALLRLKRQGSSAPLNHKARSLDSAMTQPRKISKSSGPNAPASWGSLVRFRFPLPEDVNCEGRSFDNHREALFKGPPTCLQITAYEKKFMNDVELGGADVNLESLGSGGQIEEWVPLRAEKDGITW